MHDLEQDVRYIRRAIAIAESAASTGRRPFDAAVVRASGTIVAEVGSVAPGEVRDWTAHSEMLALRAASAVLAWAALADCTLYASTEPCPMCAAAMFWCNVPRLVYSASKPKVRALRASFSRAAGLEMSAREVLARAPRPMTVVGPVVEDEGLAVHHVFWQNADRAI